MPILGTPLPSWASTGVHAASGELPVIGVHGEDPTGVLRILKRRGFTTVWATEVADALAGKGSLPAQPAMVVFDDGDGSWYTTTHAAVTTHKMKVVMGVTSDYLTNGSIPGVLNGPAMTWAQAREMHATGYYDWQNHSKTHMAKPTDADWTACSTAITTQLGVAAPVAAIYPYGSYDAGMVDRVRQLGFKLGFKFSEQDDLRPSRFPGHGPLTINRAMDLADPVKWARQGTLYNYEHDMTGGRNAGNALGYWTFSGPEAYLGESGRILQINSTAATAALSATTTDYFHVVGGTLYSHCRADSVGHTAGVARISIRQYDAARVELARIDVASYAAEQGTVILPRDVTLDPACRFVRLEVATDAAYTGTFSVREWIVYAR